MRPSTSTPSRNDGVTMQCPVCERRFAPTGRQRVCSAACRQALFGRRRAAVAVPAAVPPHRSRREATIYACPVCEARYLGDQRCSECGVFCRRVGAGGPCPACGEPVAIAELVDGRAGPA
jgi:hypothetical protein